MTKPSKIYKPFDIIVIPFPFSDKLEQKKRPALVLSSEEFNSKSQHQVTAMITSAKQSEWPFDTPINNKKHAGLPIDCLIRMKFYTADQSIIIRKAGSLSKADQKSFRENFMRVLIYQEDKLDKKFWWFQIH